MGRVDIPPFQEKCGTRQIHSAMSLTNEERKTLIALHIKKAHETFDEIGVLTDANKWNGASNRLYYAVFHAISALLIHDGYSIYSHKGSHATLH